MFIFSSLDEIKQEAQAFQQTLNDLNPASTISLGHCYELIARRCKFDCWRDMKKFYAPEKAPDEPSFGRVRVRNVSIEEIKKECLREKVLRDSCLAKPVTKTDYAEAVQTLVEATEMSGTAGAMVSSLLLLSLYNGDAWKFELPDLCRLDTKHYIAAIKAIRGRYEVNEEPHRLVKNGEAIFSDLWDRWARFHKDNVWKNDCDWCWGRGKDLDEEGEIIGDCSKCKGRGYRDPLVEMAELLKKIAEYEPSETENHDPLEVVKSWAGYAISDYHKFLN